MCPAALRLRLFLLPLLLLCCAPPAQAETINIVLTGGGAGSSGPFNGNLRANFGGAPGFSFFAMDLGPRNQPVCGLCLPGGGLPGSLQLGALDFAAVTYNGMSYDRTSAVIFGGGIFTLAPPTIPTDLSPVMAPFTYSGSVNVIPHDGSGPLLFTLTGRGTATFTFVQSGGLNGGSVSFAFQPAAVPEPATMILLGTGLAGVVGAARRRRRRANS